MLPDRVLRNLYSSPDMITRIKWRGMRWANHVAIMGGRNLYRVSWDSPKERGHLEGKGGERCDQN
jgi:hypothetical protein